MRKASITSGGRILSWRLTLLRISTYTLSIRSASSRRDVRLHGDCARQMRGNGAASIDTLSEHGYSGIARRPQKNQFMVLVVLLHVQARL
jgi:hypothetical protein